MKGCFLFVKLAFGQQPGICGKKMPQGAGAAAAINHLSNRILVRLVALELRALKVR
jgi:hypothetical protein